MVLLLSLGSFGINNTLSTCSKFSISDFNSETSSFANSTTSAKFVADDLTCCAEQYFFDFATTYGFLVSGAAVAVTAP